MPIEPEQYRDWVCKRKDSPERKALAYEALDAYEGVCEQPTIARSDIEPIVLAARSPYLVAWDVGMEFLLRLAEIHTCAQDAMREILEGKKVKERFQLIASLRPSLPKSLCIELIRKALTDKGNRVREKAAEASDRLQLSELVADIERRLATELTNMRSAH